MHLTAVRRLTANEHLSFEFATEWPTYDLDEKTRALLTYAVKLTDTPSLIDDSDVQAMRLAGWDERGIWEATALISFFNFSGRMEAASGLPPDQVPANSRLKEADTGGQGISALQRRAT